MATPQNQPKAAVIRYDPLEGRNGWSEVIRTIPAWLISAAIHGVLVFLFLLVFNEQVAKASEDEKKKEEAQAAQETQKVNTKIDPPKPEEEPELTNIDVGVNVKEQTNYDVNRIEEVSVPGPVDPNKAIGIVGAPEGPPVTVPPPPGTGRGTGGAADLPGLPGGGVVDPNLMKGGFGGLKVSGGFGGRSGATRERLVTEGGGSKASEAAVAKGLMWLALHQAPQGHWALDQFNLHARGHINAGVFINENISGKGQKNDTAGVAFGLLPFLAAGITHKPSGRPLDDQYCKTVKRALDWMILNQGKDGRFGGSSMYEHGLASIAICEAYGLSADPALKYPAQKALDYIIRAQDPNGGGWRYHPKEAGDTSVVGWQVMALKSGQMSGLSVPNITLKGAERYLDACESTDGGGYGYTGPGDSPTMSSVGLLCRQYLGTPRRNNNLRTGVEKLMKNYPPSAQRNIYYEYYATQVFHHMGGEYWEFWNKGTNGKNGMRDVLLGRQDKDGSFNPAGDAHSGGAGGRIMCTSLSLLTLEVYYRHLPLYQRVDTEKKVEAKK